MDVSENNQPDNFDSAINHPDEELLGLESDHNFSSAMFEVDQRAVLDSGFIQPNEEPSGTGFL